MGGSSTKEEPNLKPHELKEFSKITSFSPNELNQLYKYYTYISSSKADDGVIEFTEFSNALPLPSTLISKRIFQLFDANEDGFINFREFVIGLTYLYETTEQQILFSFKILDLNDCGYCTKDNLKTILLSYISSAKPSLCAAMPKEKVEAMVNKMVDQTFLEMNPEGKDRVSYEEYKKLYLHKGFSPKWLFLDVEKLDNWVREINERKPST